MRRALLLAVLFGGTAVALTVIPPTPAIADTSQCSTPSSACAGRATFASYGEVFKVFDQAADGHSAVVLYWLSDGTGPHFGWNSQGNGTTFTLNLELAEGDWIFYRVCLGESGPKTLVSGTCSAGVTDYA